MNELIGRRLKVARENSGLTQAELAKLLDFNDRQTLTAIETGNRKINADELLRAINILGPGFGLFYGLIQIGRRRAIFLAFLR